jgi:hypothetical protein
MKKSIDAQALPAAESEALSAKVVQLPAKMKKAGNPAAFLKEFGHLFENHELASAGDANFREPVCTRKLPPYTGINYKVDAMGIVTRRPPVNLIGGNTGGYMRADWNGGGTQISGIFFDFKNQECFEGDHITLDLFSRSFGEIQAYCIAAPVAEAEVEVVTSVQDRSTGEFLSVTRRRIGRSSQRGIGGSTVRLMGEFASDRLVIPWHKLTRNGDYRVNFTTVSNVEALSIPGIYAWAKTDVNVRLESINICCVPPFNPG